MTDVPMTDAGELLDLATEIEQSDGLVLSLTGTTRQLGIKRTAQVIAALRRTAASPAPMGREAIIKALEDKKREVNFPAYGDRRGDWRSLRYAEIADAILALASLPAERGEADVMANKLDAIFDRIEVSCDWRLSSEERQILAEAANALRASPPSAGGEADHKSLSAAETKVSQHLGWLKGYVECTTADNWQDMRLRCERQLEELSACVSSPAGNADAITADTLANFINATAEIEYNEGGLLAKKLLQQFNITRRG